MKIERLYKLNQFVEFIEKLSHKELNEINGKAPAMMTYSIKFFSIVKFKDRIKQSVMKEMVVNNESKDWFNEDGSINVKIQLRWMEAEKKVIFTAEAIKDCNNLGIHTKDFYFGRYIISFYDDGEINLSIDESEDIAVKTLEDLAYYTNGELKTKNFEI